MRLRSLRFFLIVLLLSTWGCAAQTPRVMDPRVKIIDPTPPESIVVTDIISVIDKGGLMEVQVDGTNLSNSYLKLEYRIDWLDGNGFLIPTTITKWTEFPAFPKAEFRFKTIAPTKTAADFRILIRRGKN